MALSSHRVEAQTCFDTKLCFRGSATSGALPRRPPPGVWGYDIALPAGGGCGAPGSALDSREESIPTRGDPSDSDEPPAPDQHLVDYLDSSRLYISHYVTRDN